MQQKKLTDKQYRLKQPFWKKCCCNLCAIGCGARCVACAQVLLAVAIVLQVNLGYSCVRPVLADTSFVVSTAHGSLALLACLCTFLALHFLQWPLLIVELIFLTSAIAQHWLCVLLFTMYSLADLLTWLNSHPHLELAKNETELLCVPRADSDELIFKWKHCILACSYALLAVVNMWFFNVVLNAYYYVTHKKRADTMRRARAAENFASATGCMGRGGGLVAACVGSTSAMDSTPTHSRSTLTTSLTATTATYDRCTRDPDLLLKY